MVCNFLFAQLIIFSYLNPKSVVQSQIQPMPAKMKMMFSQLQRVKLKCVVESSLGVIPPTNKNGTTQHNGAKIV
jgi:hypothetical protein